jgi:hypothetical protein
MYKAEQEDGGQGTIKKVKQARQKTVLKTVVIKRGWSYYIRYLRSSLNIL